MFQWHPTFTIWLFLVTVCFHWYSVYFIFIYSSSFNWCHLKKSIHASWMLDWMLAFSLHRPHHVLWNETPSSNPTTSCTIYSMPGHKNGGCFFFSHNEIPSLKLTFSHLNIGLTHPKGNNRIPTIHLYILISGRVYSWWKKSCTGWGW